MKYHECNAIKFTKEQSLAVEVHLKFVSNSFSNLSQIHSLSLSLSPSLSIYSFLLPSISHKTTLEANLQASFQFIFVLTSFCLLFRLTCPLFSLLLFACTYLQTLAYGTCDYILLQSINFYKISYAMQLSQPLWAFHIFHLATNQGKMSC